MLFKPWPWLALILGALAAAASGPPQRQVALSYSVMQSGSRSGITNTVFTRWMPPRTGFAGLSGHVSMGGNSNSFSEGLVTLGTTADDQAACAARNATWPQTPPAMQRVWAAILKTNAGGAGASAVGVRADFALPFAVPPPGARGACLVALVSAGYPYLDAATARYVTTTLTLQASLLPAATNAAVVLPLGLGGEFSFPTGSAQTLTTYVGIKASRVLVMDGIAGSVSAAAVMGAPPGSSWRPAPASFWTMDTKFVFMPAPVCASAGFTVRPSNGTYAVIRRATAAPFTMPSGSTTVMRLPVSSTGATAIQRSAFQASSLVLAPGDCLIAFHSMLSAQGAAEGLVDYENQSTVYFRLVQ